MNATPTVLDESASEDGDLSTCYITTTTAITLTLRNHEAPQILGVLGRGILLAFSDSTAFLSRASCKTHLHAQDRSHLRFKRFILNSLQQIRMDDVIVFRILELHCVWV